MSRAAAKRRIPARTIPATRAARLRDTTLERKRTEAPKVHQGWLTRSREEISVARASLDVRALQAPIGERYNLKPQPAQIRLGVGSGRSDLSVPLHCAGVPDWVPEVYG